MNKDKINESFHWAWMLKLEVCLLIFSMALGHILYSGSLGWGDSLNQLSRPLTVSEFIYSWWHELNGRMGQAVLYAFTLLPLRWLSSTPESFPWWAVRSVALFCVLSVPLLMTASLPHEIRPKRNWHLLILLLLSWIVWSLNPINFETSAWFTTAEIVGYSFPIFLISLSFLLLTKIHPLTYSKNHALLSVALTIGAFTFATLGEQYLLVFPIFAIGIMSTRIARRELSSTLAIRLGVQVIAGVAIGFGLYWAAPAQQARNKLLDLHIGNMWEVYEKSTLWGYQYLFQQPFDITINLPKTLIIVAHTIFVSVAAKWALDDIRKGEASFPYSSRGSGVMLLTLLVAYHACFAPLVISGYFPGYALTFPSMLLMMSLAIGTLILLRRMELRKVAKKLMRIISCIGILAIGSAILYFAVCDYRKNSETATLVSTNDRRRVAIYNAVVTEITRSNINRFALINCPMASPRYSWSMEVPWGLSGYFNWRGAPSIKVFLQGNSDFPANWSDGSYKIIDCSAS